MTDTLDATVNPIVQQLLAENKFIEAGDVLLGAQRFAEASILYEGNDNEKAAHAAEQDNNYLRAAGLYSSLEHTDLIVAHCLAKAGRLNDAREIYKKRDEQIYVDLVRADMNVMTEASQKGQEALSSGNLDTALEQFELLVNKFPGHGESRHSLTRVYQMLGEHEKAIEQLHFALTFNPEQYLREDDIENMAIQLTHLYGQKGTHKLLLYDRVFKRLYLQGHSLMKNTTLTTEESANTINTYKAENPDSHLLLGLMYVRSGLYRDAIDEFAQLEGRTVDTAEARKQINEESRSVHRTAVGHFRAGIYEEAVKHYHLSMLLDPTNAWAFHDLGETYIRLGREDHAKSFFTLAVDVDKTGKIVAYLAKKYPTS